MNQKAFTLIELLVVVAIIGILAAVGVVAYDGYTKSAKKKAVETNFSIVVKYLKSELMMKAEEILKSKKLFETRIMLKEEALLYNQENYHNLEIENKSLKKARNVST